MEIESENKKKSGLPTAGLIETCFVLDTTISMR